MNRDAGDIVDRYSIAILKDERRVFNEGFLDLQLRIPKNHDFWDRMLEISIGVNSCIWELESDLRREMLDHDLEETGRRAIMIRKINGVRVKVKNLINFMVGEGVQDVKWNHISEDNRGDGGGGEAGETGAGGDDMPDGSRAFGELPERGGDIGGGVHGLGEGGGQGSGEQGARSSHRVCLTGRLGGYTLRDA